MCVSVAGPPVSQCLCCGAQRSVWWRAGSSLLCDAWRFQVVGVYILQSSLRSGRRGWNGERREGMGKEKGSLLRWPGRPACPLQVKWGRPGWIFAAENQRRAAGQLLSSGCQRVSWLCEAAPLCPWGESLLTIPPLGVGEWADCSAFKGSCPLGFPGPCF